jgi:hypothetical protein
MKVRVHGWMDDGVTTRILVRGKYMKVGGWMGWMIIRILLTQSECGWGVVITRNW